MVVGIPFERVFLLHEDWVVHHFLYRQIGPPGRGMESGNSSRYRSLTARGVALATADVRDRQERERER
jgi:hypothetical protein